MAESFYFISYSHADGEEIALKLADQLVAGPPTIGIWLDQRNLQPGIDRYAQILEGLKGCQGLLYLMTSDSTNSDCPCTREWIRALQYKKPILPLIFHPGLEMPFQLEPREPISFTESFDAGIARLREHVRWRDTPEGGLHTVRERLRDARRDFDSAQKGERDRIQKEITQLQEQINDLQPAIDNPEAAQQRTQESIARGLERERQPEEPVAPKVQTRFINRLPLIPPTYFQDRHFETAQIGAFLRDENLRLMTVVGRGGVGKTVMVCRLLRSLEGGRLPDDGGELAVDGIVYIGGHVFAGRANG